MRIEDKSDFLPVAAEQAEKRETQPGAHDGAGMAIIFHPDLYRQEKTQNDGGIDRGRSPAARLDEAVRLAEAINLQIIHADIVPVPKIRPATLFGSGKVEELARLIADLCPSIVIIDGTLTPGQQRNLERAWSAKVIDRTGLILEIFGARARTREGSLQVELAHLTYQRSRLVRSWTHLERQRGGLGFIGGPGETQIEVDRRLISERITKLSRELGKVRKTRESHREGRRKTPFPIIAFVGYTNAGKSTLFNRLTQAQVFAQDLLFATLDPTMRGVDLPNGKRVIFSDTVGFISDLPTHLVAAFRATLEEVLAADVIVHVRDISHPETAQQKQDVIEVLEELGISDLQRQNMIEVHNKTDLLSDDERREITNIAKRQDNCIALSAFTGEGCNDLLLMIGQQLAAEWRQCALILAADEGAILAWLYRHAEVQSLDYDDEGNAHLNVSISPSEEAKLEKLRAAKAL